MFRNEASFAATLTGSSNGLRLLDCGVIGGSGGLPSLPTAVFGTLYRDLFITYKKVAISDFGVYSVAVVMVVVAAGLGRGLQRIRVELGAVVAVVIVVAVVAVEWLSLAWV